VESSLKRLRTDYIDIMNFHGVRPEHYPVVAERFYPVMKKLQETGKIRFVGISGRYIVDPSHKTVTAALKSHPSYWDVVMLKYGILNQYAAKEALPLARKHNIGVINMSAVRSKLSNPDQLKTTLSDWQSRSLIPADLLQDDDPLGWLVHGDVQSVISAGYKFGADHPAITSVLTGTTNIIHLEANTISMEKPFLPVEDTKRLKELLGHLAEWA
jgi:predicted aldo/keto reductase-like oxidoreductase